MLQASKRGRKSRKEGTGKEPQHRTAARKGDDLVREDLLEGSFCFRRLRAISGTVCLSLILKTPVQRGHIEVKYSSTSHMVKMFKGHIVRTGTVDDDANQRRINGPMGTEILAHVPPLFIRGGNGALS